MRGVEVLQKREFIALVKFPFTNLMVTLALDVLRMFSILRLKIAWASAMRKSRMYIFLTSIRCSVKLQDLFNDVELELGVKVSLSFLNVETRRSSTFEMIRQWCATRRIFSALVLRYKQFEDYLLSESELRAVSKVCGFTKGAACATECPFDSSYVTFDASSRIFGILKFLFQGTMEAYNRF